MKKLSIVIPTYNRGEQLKTVIDHILDSDIEGIEFIEIIIVDDSSIIPTEKFIDVNKVKAPFSMRVIRQSNSGPATARNNGLRQTTTEIVIFIDDDVLVSASLLKKHLYAHEIYPNSVIIGSYPLWNKQKNTPLLRWLNKLINHPDMDTGKDHYLLTTEVASGNLSIERKQFLDEPLYNDKLRTPAAEEYDLMARLSKKRIKVYYNPSITGWHLQPVTIENKCQQEYKYGVGIAEVALKIPESMEYENLRHLFVKNTEDGQRDGTSTKIKKIFKRLFSTKPGRKILTGVIKFLEFLLPFDFILFPVYRFSMGVFLFAGVNDGVRLFKNNI